MWFRLRRSLSRATVAEPRSHSGFTLVELVVVMAVIGVLISLVAPAVQRVRESARAIDCRSRLRQIGIALHNYSDTHPDRLPPAFEPCTFFPGGARIETNLSMQAQLLPYLDLGPLWGTIDLRETGVLRRQEPPTSQFNATLLQTRVAAFECPSDAVVPGGISYRASSGTSPARYEAPPPGTYMGIVQVTGCRLSRITDGLSTTAFFSERVIGDRNSQVYDAWRDVSYSVVAPPTVSSPDDAMAMCSTTTAAPAQHGSYAGATWLITSEMFTSYNHVLPPNSRIPDCHDGVHAITARSFHAGGVHVLMGDGAVRFVSESVHLPVWRSLASLYGAETVSDF